MHDPGDVSQVLHLSIGAGVGTIGERSLPVGDYYVNCDSATDPVVIDGQRGQEASGWLLRRDVPLRFRSGHVVVINRGAGTLRVDFLPLATEPLK